MRFNMLDYHQFFESKHHKKNKKSGYYGSLPFHKCCAKERMNKPSKQKLIYKGSEKIYQLCDRIHESNPPKQFIKPRSHIHKSQRRRCARRPLS